MAGLEGARLGNWVVQRRLGKTGDIYLAQAPDPSVQVALKIIPRAIDAVTSAKQARVAQALVAHARTLAALNHPNLLPIYDVGEQDGTFYVAMAYVPEGSLADMIGPGPRRQLSLPLAPLLVASIAEQAAAGLQIAHDHNILHGNVKPSNLLTFALLDTDQPAETQVQIFVSDFGTADFSTRSAAQVGAVDAPLYIAPEQDRGLAGPASDQYALACVAYLLLTGRPAFFGSTSMSYGLVPVKLPPPSHINPKLSPEIDAVLACALSPEPADRYARVEDFAQALRQIVGPAPATHAVQPRVPPWLHMTLPIPAQTADALASGAWPDVEPLVPRPIRHPGQQAPGKGKRRVARQRGAPLFAGGRIALSRRQVLAGALVATGLVVAGGFTLKQLGVFGAASDSVGVFRPDAATFVLKRDLGGDTGATRVTFGQPGDLPVVGDWTGSGIDTVGVFRPSTGTFYLLDANRTGAAVAHTVAFGQRGDLPIAGDWSGRGRDGIGVFRPATRTFYLKLNLSSGPPDYTIPFGLAGDVPLAGDWNGEGTTGIGVFRPGNGTFYLVRQVCAGCAPAPGFVVAFGQPHDVPFVGDWSRVGRTGLGVFRPATGTMLCKDDATRAGAADRTLTFGQEGDVPLAGRWGG